MRSLDDARVAWDELRQYKRTKDLKEAVRLDGDSSLATAGGRSACWKVFLLFDTLDTSSWIRTLSSARSAYNSLKSHFLRHIENPDELTSGYDPLSGESDLSHDKSSPWTQLHKDEELRGEILQDVVRCMPENLYFRQPDTQRALTDILFVFCKLNPDVGYRQGMHELLAPILWAVERDAIDLGQSSKALGEDAVIKTMFDSEHVEHDTFALFGQVMQSAKVFYEQTTSDGNENPMVSRSRRIFSDMLPQVDEKLATHLARIDIVPQVFLIRWVRLLFGREFAFDEMLTMWDVIFAEDPSLEVVDHICIAMLLRIRWDLIEADYNVALTLLLRYPEPGTQLPAQTLALDGLYLREHMDYHSGSYLVSKYTGKPLEQAGRPVTPPALQRNITTMAVATKASATSPTRSPGPNRNLESVFQSTARNIYARGEKLGIGKVVRSAVDEVHKKAQEIRDAQTPATPPPSWRQRGTSRTSLGAEPLLTRVQTLEVRSRQLAKLLEGAVSELWEYQRAASESAMTDAEAQKAGLEQLSVAIAKVQFIQVYLDDPGMPLPQEAETTGGSPQAASEGASQAVGPEIEGVESTPAYSRTGTPVATAGRTEAIEGRGSNLDEAQPPKSSVEGLLDPESFADPSLTETGAPGSVKVSPEIVVQEDNAASITSEKPDQPSNKDQQRPTPLSSARPRLEQSSLSWMLDQQGSKLRQPSPSASGREQARFRSSLFGTARADDTVSGDSSRRVSGEMIRGQPLGEPNVQEDAGFDMGSLRHSKGRKT
ncbi:uncharacterized protein LTR77_002588 [Saxophila tyrrhenica]|uniref:Rab-GAP TBC domain-containing protein n=1 Tax=Saxophila tyrrhenica TaxID=1690608 RepID=A0AAV9PLN4_9PEZI|nr:hypothetical protein LTR77_002588 [Saxophila tyrrhenica]